MRTLFLTVQVTGILTFALVSIGCRAESAAQVTGFVSGRLSISADVDSVADYRDFEVLIASNLDGDIDTLGFARTDSLGNFSTPVRSTQKGVYPLLISRGGQTLALEEIVIADGDSSRVAATFPLNGRPVRIVSMENAAWSAYKNTKAQYNKLVLELVESQPDYTEEEMGRIVRQSSSIYWGLRETFPGTLGSVVAEAESVVMLEGWADSVVVDHARKIAEDHPSMIAIVRAGRRSEGRLRGQAAAIAFIRSFLSDPDASLDSDAALLSEVVIAHLDSSEQVQAVAVARELQSKFPDGAWSRWAQGAIYEVENLLPGMPAPDFSVLDINGEVIDLQSLRDQFFMLEFYTPTHPLFQQELGLRQAMLNALDDDVFESISISVDPDSAYNEALLDGRDFQGRFVFEPEGLESPIATAYNVNVVPTRILVDPRGLIVGKYVGATLEELEQELEEQFRALTGG
jgi:peroxiredoxin